MVIWIFFISAVCTLIYSVIAHDYLQYEAMWLECLFPGAVIWNKLEKRGYNKAVKIIVSLILSVVLFTYTLAMILFLVFFLVTYALEGLTKRIFKKK